MKETKNFDFFIVPYNNNKEFELKKEYKNIKNDA